MSSVSFWVLTLPILVLATSAEAQTVDYTAAEQMFGEPVTVSATGKPQRASEAPASIDIVTAEDIRRSGATDLPSVLRFVPGLDVRRYGQFDAAVGIRGYNTALNPRVLVLLDGRQVYQDDYGYTLWSQIPVTLAEIRQIEIIRGPNAALYGFNAVSGVINIVTYDPLRDRKNVVDLRGGTQAQVYGEGTATVQVPDRLGVRVSAKGTRADEFSGNRTADAIDAPHVGTGSVDARFRVNEKAQLDIAATVGTIETDYYQDLGSYIPLENTSDSLRGALSVDTAIGLMQFDVYRNATTFASGGSQFDLAWKQDVTVAKVSDLVRLGSDHTIRVGAEYRRNTISSDAFGGEMGSDLFAGSAMWNWQIVPSLSLTNAVRMDVMRIERGEADIPVPGVGLPFGERRITEPSFNSALLWSPTDVDTFRLSAARALQLPSLVSYGLLYSQGPITVAGTTDLDPSAVVNYEAGYSRKLPGLGAQINASVFVQESDRTIGSPFASGFNFTPQGQVLALARNFDGSSAVGGEIGIEGASEAGWRWNLSYALAHIDDRSPADRLAEAPSVNYAEQNPAHSVVAGLGYTWRKLEIDARAKWQSAFADFQFDETMARTVAVEVPDYVTFDARIGYSIDEHATVSLTAEQFNSADIRTSAGRQTERRVLAGLKLEF
ncbi:TonB-dependent receptor plug domain-containing protein [Aureimonas jatrophae]|uniref:Iron complex outermembrane recepter protein n=1 Tax=Aureimonas jatrophae TaxID=1166073 RepID=A0A1H0MY73_9HYPH|nr:TonB-dependent receptor [Aureimonas jatrophae]MBB3953002.1 iron complex outermembrane receptor protein [Aureimonas jatrophae]SDO85363.1 iron complex outermembrane recepter protein [Aureimonas jatrophae]